MKGNTLYAKEIIEFLDSKFPKEFAYKNDNIGMQIGTNYKQVKKVLVALEATNEVVLEAIENNVDMLVIHHPLIFKSINNITNNSLLGTKLIHLVQNDIVLHVMHTNIDFGKGGLNDYLGSIIGLKNMRNIEKIYDDFDKEINNCGIGVIGDLTDKMSIEQFIPFIKEALKLSDVRAIYKSEKQEIQTVGICSGSGSDHLVAAMDAGADIYLTGDISYHAAQNANEIGFSAIDIGHYTESFVKDVFYDLLMEVKTTTNSDVEIIKSKKDMNPYKFL